MQELKVMHLPATERAVFLELHQQVLAQDMKLREGGKAESNNDRANRLKELMRTSKSPEEALLRCSSHLALRVSSSPTNTLLTCDIIIQTRERQYKSHCKEVEQELDVAAWLMQRCNTLNIHYESWKRHVREDGLGDRKATKYLVAMIDTAEARGKELDKTNFSRGKPISKASNVELNKQGKGPDHVCEEAQELRNLAGHLRGLSDELVSRARALRFVQTVSRVQLWQSEGTAAPLCSYCDCKASAPEKVIVLGLCGHLVCDGCLASTGLRDDCVVPDCHADVLDYHKTRASELRHKDPVVTISAPFYGKKIAEIIHLIKGIPAKDQVLMFVQFDDLMETISSALKDYGITHFALTDGAYKDTPKMMENFQKDRTEKKRKVLVLNSSTESAAGA